MNEIIMDTFVVVVFSVLFTVVFNIFFDSLFKEIKGVQNKPLTKSIILMVVFLLSITSTGFAISLDNSGPPLPPKVNGSLVYKINIEEQELLDPVANSQVIIEIDGQTAAITTSDSNGLSVLLVDSSFAGQRASLIVQATGYAIHIEDVELTVGGLPEVVRLKPEPEAIKEPDRN